MAEAIQHAHESAHLCIICQVDNKQNLMKASTEGLQSVNNIVKQRLALHNDDFKEATLRLNVIVQEETPHFFWHRRCRSLYMAKNVIARLKTKSSQVINKPSSSSVPIEKSFNLRSKLPPMNWEKCMFCQENQKEAVHLIQELKLSRRILQAAKYDRYLSVKLTCVNDLTAADGRYHRTCLIKFERRSKRVADGSHKGADIILEWLCQELEAEANQANILDCVHVWDRYCEIANEAQLEVPSKFLSRRSTFKEEAAKRLQDVYDFVVLQDQPHNEPRTVLVPCKFRHIAMSSMVQDDTTEGCIPIFKHKDQDRFLSMLHLALQIRDDMMSQPRPTGIDISENKAIDSVPSSLYMFLNLLIGGQSMLEHRNDEEDEGDKNTAKRQLRILSIAQDIMYTASEDKFIPPKHIGLASTLHQATRSKELVEMFHQAGHIMSYREVIKLDTEMAKKTLESLGDDGAIVPQNLVKGRFIHFSVDNIDINEYTPDGKGTFHATQVAAWQRGPPEVDLLEGINLNSKSEALRIPRAMTDIIEAPNRGVTERPFSGEIKADCFTQTSEQFSAVQKAQATDIAFFISRTSQKPMPSWTMYNEKASTFNPEKTTVGYLPIIQAPASDLDTLNTVVKRVLHISKSMNQQHVILTVDEALYPKLLELKWSVDEYKDILIPCLGGLHIVMNFLRVIGQHMADSGLSDLWIECGVLGKNAAQNVMAGKPYARAMRSHKLTLQALWQLLLPQLFAYMDRYDALLKDELSDLSHTMDANHIAEMVDKLVSERFQQSMMGFVKLLTDDNPNGAFWWDYMTMVSILLFFIRAQRDGLWDLHLYAFKRMLPFFFRYDHINYSRWGAVYLAEMAALPPEILAEFQKGNFVVKCSDRRFNQVSADQSTEWLNAIGKKSGGLVGITRRETSLNRWTLSYNLRTIIASQTKAMHKLSKADEDDENAHMESPMSRLKKDDDDERRIFLSLKEHGMFQDTGATLKNIMNKDMVTPDIQASLLGAERLGQEDVKVFIQKRLSEPPESDQYLKLRSPIHKNKAKTFSSLYEVVQHMKNRKQSIIKVDREILQRIVTAYEAGRKVDLENILQHELMPVPPSLASTNGSLHATKKSVLLHILTEHVETSANVTLNESSCLVIDGQALIMSLGKQSDMRTFADYANKFVNTVLKMGENYQRVDVVFDRYYKESIKTGTRLKRKQLHRPVRREIANQTVPLPEDWSNFIALEENKADLACLLSNHLIELSPKHQPVIVVSGGFTDETTAKSSDPDLDVSFLMANHEEADTRMILHCIHAPVKTVVVFAQDTDVLLLLVAHYDRIGCSNVYLKAGSSKNPKYFPVHDIQKAITDSQVDTLLAFHAITGCDSVSQFSGHGKKKAWQVFQQHHNDLADLGKGPLTDDMVASAEKFICKIYGEPEVTCNKARVKLFCKGFTQENLPPTSDAVKLHIMRSHYQALIWNQAHIPQHVLPPVDTMGWSRIEGQLVPQLLSLPPIPKICREFTSCSCSKGCLSQRCSCRYSSNHTLSNIHRSWLYYYQCF